jgi:hypothetical protein
MLRQPQIRASRTSPAQKWPGLRVVLFQKLFKGYIFCFLGDSVGRYIFELFVNKFEEKALCGTVIYCRQNQLGQMADFPHLLTF